MKNKMKKMFAMVVALAMVLMATAIPQTAVMAAPTNQTDLSPAQSNLNLNFATTTQGKQYCITIDFDDMQYAFPAASLTWDPTNHWYILTDGDGVDKAAHFSVKNNSNCNVDMEVQYTSAAGTNINTYQVTPKARYNKYSTSGGDYANVGSALTTASNAQVVDTKFTMGYYRVDKDTHTVMIDGAKYQNEYSLPLDNVELKDYTVGYNDKLGIITLNFTDSANTYTEN